MLKPQPATTPLPSSTNCLQLVDSCINLEVADTPAARTLGLSNRESLLENNGMLFIFEQSAEQCFWMKDMKFSIDMIWLNDRKVVTKIEKNVAPETYPANFCAANTKYVIELSAGSAENHSITVGQKLRF